jgi:hypothetical protein
MLIDQSNILSMNVGSVDAQLQAEKTEPHLKSLAKNVQNNEWPFKFQVFCRSHWAVNSHAKGLIL